MAVTPIDLRASRDALAFAAEFVSGRFKDAQDHPGGGWSVLCPLCDSDTRLVIARELTFDHCPNGHTQAQILAATSTREPSKWQFQSAAEFLVREFPPLRWLYLDLVPADSVTVVMAAPNAGKTFFGTDVIAQVAARSAAAGRRVTIVEEEGTGAALQWRLGRALASVGINADSPAAHLVSVAWNTGRSLRHPSDLQSLVDECSGADLVMLDSLAALSGGIDENSSKDMAEVSEALHQLKSGAEAAVLPLHHMTKAAWRDGETPRLEHMRGHGALPGRADAVLALVPLDSDVHQIRFELYCVKQRDGSKPKPRKFSIALDGPAATATIEAKDPNEGALVQPAKRGRGRPSKLTYTQLKTSIVSIVRNGQPLSGNEVCYSVGGSKTHAGDAIRDLLKTGILKRDVDDLLVIFDSVPKSGSKSKPIQNHGPQEPPVPNSPLRGVEFREPGGGSENSEPGNSEPSGAF